MAGDVERNGQMEKESGTLGIHPEHSKQSISSLPMVVPVVPIAVPQPSACFRGSFHPRAKEVPIPKKRPFAETVQHYFQEGWDEVSIWKSAVSSPVEDLSVAIEIFKHSS